MLPGIVALIVGLALIFLVHSFVLGIVGVALVIAGIVMMIRGAYFDRRPL